MGIRDREISGDRCLDLLWPRNLHVGLPSFVSYDNPTTVRELHVFDWCSGEVAPMATNVMKIDLLESEQTLV